MPSRIATLTIALVLALPGVASAQNLVGHWTFNGNQNDSSGHNNQARRNGAAIYASDQDGQALNLSGNSLTIPNSPSLQTNQFTVEYSVYTNTARNYMPVASKGAAPGVTAWQTNIVAGVDSDGRAIGGQSLQFCIGGVCKTSPALSRSPIGRWMQVEFEYDGTTATGYADGAPVVSFDGNFLPGNSKADVELGNAAEFNGLMRDLRIYDAALKLSPQLSQSGGQSGGAALGVNAITIGSAAISSSVVLATTAAWTATANNSFLHVTAGSASGTGNAVVFFSADAFSATGSRTGTLTIAGLTLTVTQAGTNYVIPPTPTILVNLQDQAGGIAIDGAGNIYIAGDRFLEKVTPARVVTTLATGLNSAKGVAVDGAGNVYIADTGNNVIKEWTASTQQITTRVSGLNGPTGVAVDGSGNLYIADSKNSALEKWTASTQQLNTLATASVFGVALDSAGNVYFTEPAGGNIAEFNPSTQQVTIRVSGLITPTGVAVDGSGNLYFMARISPNNLDVAVSKWTAATQQVTTVALPPSGYAFDHANDGGVAVGSQGNVYAPSFGYVCIFVLPYALVPSATLDEPIAAGTDALPAVLPVTTDLTGPFAPGSDQSWLTSGTVANGIVNFSFAADAAGIARTAHLTILGIASTINQDRATVPNVAGQTQATASTAITGGFLTVGTISPVLSATIAVGSVAGVYPAAGTLVPLGSPVNLLISSGSAALGVNAIQVGSAAGGSSVALSAAGAWAATSNSGFLHVTTGSASGTGNALIGFTFDAFSSTGSRIGTLTIAGLTFTVTQFGTNFIANPASATSVTRPNGVAADASGNADIVDPTFTQVEQWPSQTRALTGLVTSGLHAPNGVAVDASGNVYISDSGTYFSLSGNTSGGIHTIWKWTAATGQLSTLVSSGLILPQGLAVDRSGNVYIADAGDHTVKEWNLTTGALTTLASGLNQPFALVMAGVSVDVSGNVYFSDSGNNAIRKWTAATQVVTTLISSGLNFPQGVAVDGSGNLYIADSQGFAVRKWNAETGQLTTLASPGTIHTSYSPVGVATDPAGDVFFTFTDNDSSDLAFGGVTVLYGGFQQVAAVPNVVSQTQAAATSAITGVSLAVGTVTNGLSATVPIGSVISSNPAAGTILNIGSAVNLVISVQAIQVPNVVGEAQAAATTAITGANLVLGAVTGATSFTVAAGNVISENPAAGTTVAAGTAVSLVVSLGSVVPNVIGQTQTAATSAIAGTGLVVGTITTAASATGLNNPGGVISDLVGNVYIADTGNNAIKKWNAATGTLTTLVSTGLNQPGAVGIDKAGNVYIADTGNNAIKEWNAVTNQVTTLVSTGLNHPQGIVVDRYFQGPYSVYGANQIASLGNVYIADTGNNAIKLWTPSTQQVTTLVSSGLNQPTGLGYCIGGGLVIADTGDNAIKSFNGSLGPGISTGLNRPTAVVCASYTDNATAFNGINYPPPVLTFIPTPDLYIADTGNNAIKWVNSTDGTLTTVASGLNQPFGLASDGQDNVWVAGNNAIQEIKTVCAFNSPVRICGPAWRPPTTLFRTVSPGTVSSENPAVGTTVALGTVVNLTIEGGPVALSATTVLVGSAGGSSSVFLIAPYPWNATANDSFLHLASGSGSGGGDAWVAFTIDAFTSPGIRTGTLTIAGLTFTVTQVGADYVPPISQLNTPIPAGSVVPTGVAVDGSGNVYVADATNNVIKKWSAATQQLSTLISGLSAPNAVAVDGEGNLYIGDGTAVRIWTAATQQLTTLVTISSLTGGTGNAAVALALDLSGDVYFASLNTIYKWTAATQQVAALIATGLSGPRGLAVDNSGNVYIADSGNNALKVWSASSQQVTTLPGGAGLGRPFGVAVDVGNGDVYFTEISTFAVKKLDTAGNVTQLVQASPAGSTRYRGLALDASGNLYFAETDAGVVGELAKAYVSSGSLSEPNSAGTGALPPVIPLTTNLTGAFAPASDQSWLTVGTVANGAVGFSFAANATGSPRTGHITILGTAFTINQGLQVGVPDVTGQTQGAAATAIAGAGLIVGSVTTATSGTVPVGSVISTSPTAATQVNVGSAVNLVVSTGPGQVAVPDVTGQTQGAATTAITGAGLVVGAVTTAPSATVATGSVISTNPAAATQANVGSAVNLVISTGPAQVAVPDVVGQTQVAATTAITGAGLIVGSVTTAASGTVAAGSVISTNPAATTQVNVGSAVNLVVSTGPAQVAVPDVVGQTQVAATTAITGAGLIVGSVTTAASGTVAAGSVISTSPAAATPVNIGSTVNLVVSTGPAQVAVPNVIGQTQVSATTAITGAGLIVGSVTTAASGTVAAGSVISTSPAAATPVNIGSTVNLVISTGRIIPILTWPAPATIAFGGALGSGQLNATANVSGTFSYSPPAGTVLAPGNGQTLSVTFTPTDLANYTVTAGTTVINVSSAQAAPAKANLVVTSVLTRSDGNILLVMTVANTGGTTAANVVLTAAKVGTTAGSPAPQSIGSIASGSAVQATVTVPGTAGAPGAASSLSITGSYTGGTFSSGGRITLP